ncbi:MAG TPA: SapC family protein [Magnetospirillaceae bacterium]|nr:SapC family protein [Magnetospirillaceae bacterium]
MHLVELSRQHHGGLRIDPARIGEQAARCHMVPVVVSEFRRALADFPIVLAKSQDTGQFSPYALMGLAPEENLFWDGSRIDAAHVPLNLRRLPFSIGMDQQPDGAVRNAVCVDMESPLVSKAGSEALVDGEGRDTAYFMEIQKVLYELLSFRLATEQFVQALAARDLIAELRLDIVLESGKPLVLTGLYGLDEDKFNRLADADLAGLRQDGHLTLAYAMLLSTARIQSLIDRRNRLEGQDRAWFQ